MRKKIYSQIAEKLSKNTNKTKAKILARFFKTGKGEYAENDIFLGVTVPRQRFIAKKYYKLITLAEIKKLLLSPIHEYRLTGLLILVEKYKQADFTNKEKIFNFYIKYKDRINNWDLVDLSAPKIVGNYLAECKNYNLLYSMAQSDNIWQRRIAVVSTYALICRGKFDHTLKLAEILLTDKHHLIQKAVGWMLRETGKRDVKILESFLNKKYKLMPRTMLRYAIERLSPERRDYYMQK